VLITFLGTLLGDVFGVAMGLYIGYIVWGMPKAVPYDPKAKEPTVGQLAFGVYGYVAKNVDC